jgi:hypothetical protein
MSFTLTEELRLGVYEKRVLRRISGPKREKGAGGWRRLHNEELHNLYASPYFIRVIKSRMTRQINSVTRLNYSPSLTMSFLYFHEMSPVVIQEETLSTMKI